MWFQSSQIKLFQWKAANERSRGLSVESGKAALNPFQEGAEHFPLLPIWKINGERETTYLHLRQYLTPCTVPTCNQFCWMQWGSFCFWCVWAIQASFQPEREVQGYYETNAMFFKQIYSISWAKEKVTVHSDVFYVKPALYMYRVHLWINGYCFLKKSSTNL